MTADSSASREPAYSRSTAADDPNKEPIVELICASEFDEDVRDVAAVRRVTPPYSNKSRELLD